MFLKRVLLVVSALGLVPRFAAAQEQKSDPTEGAAPPPTVIVVTPTPPAPAPAPASGTDDKKWKTIISARFDGGYAWRRLFDIPITGADLGGAVGAQPLEHGAFWGTARVLLGSTEHGLGFYDVHIGAEGEAVFDRFRIGGGAGGFLLGLARVTSKQTIRTWGLEARAFARFDVIKPDDFAIFVRAAIAVGREFYDSATVWGPTIGAGVDFDLKGKRPE